jgi:hypothetical protein
MTSIFLPAGFRCFGPDFVFDFHDELVDRLLTAEDDARSLPRRYPGPRTRSRSWTLLQLTLTPAEEGLLEVIVQLVHGPAAQEVLDRPWRGHSLPLGQFVQGRRLPEVYWSDRFNAHRSAIRQRQR